LGNGSNKLSGELRDLDEKWGGHSLGVASPAGGDLLQANDPRLPPAGLFASVTAPAAPRLGPYCTLVARHLESLASGTAEHVKNSRLT
jgi:hypothetical protein